MPGPERTNDQLGVRNHVGPPTWDPILACGRSSEWVPCDNTDCPLPIVSALFQLVVFNDESDNVKEHSVASVDMMTLYGLRGTRSKKECRSGIKSFA